MKTWLSLLVLAMALALLPCGAPAQQGTFASRALTPEAALTAARAALEHCRKNGWQAAVAVVDRAGLTQVLLRDRFAGAHTIDGAMNKAWTAASFRQSTGQLAADTQASQPMSGVRALPRVFASRGGLVIEAGGQVLGAIAVSGAPGGEADEQCAAAGIKAIADQIEF
ncbi:MAG: heme-binding protein [Burkholderiaceae bacterium]